MDIETIATTFFPILKRLYYSPLSLSDNVSKIKDIYQSASDLSDESPTKDSKEDARTRLLYRAGAICILNLIWYYFAPPSTSHVGNSFLDPLLKILCPILIRYLLDWIGQFFGSWKKDGEGGKKLFKIITKILSTLVLLYLSDLIWNFFIPSSDSEHQFRLFYGLISIPSSYIFSFTQAMVMFTYHVTAFLPSLFYFVVLKILFAVVYGPMWIVGYFLPQDLAEGVRFLLDAHVYVWTFRATLKVMIPVYVTLSGVVMALLMFPSKIKRILVKSVEKVRKDIAEVQNEKVE